MKNTQIKTIRPAMLIGLLITIIMIGIALFFQYYMGLIPCPLCIVQRVIVMALGGIFLLALLQGPKTWGRRVYGFLLTVASIAGLIVAGRHAWTFASLSIPEWSLIAFGLFLLYSLRLLFLAR